MSRTISFNYKYPYFYYGEKPKYGIKWSANQTTLNGCYTYPMEINNAVNCKHIKFDIEVVDTGYGTVTNRSWDFMVYRQSYGWIDIGVFTLPASGEYTVDFDVNYVITKLAVVPSSNPGSSRTWTTAIMPVDIIVTESVTTVDLQTNEFTYGVFPNYYGVSQNVVEVFVNVDGVLKKATNILANVDDTLLQIPKVYSGYFKTTAEQMRVFEFTPTVTAPHTIKQKSISGDHEIRLYDSSFNMVDESYFYNKTFTLTGGSLYYIAVTHYYNNTNTGESYLQIYKP